MAITSYSGASNGMQHNESSSDLVAMLQGPCNATSPHVGQLQVAAPGLLVGGVEDAVTTAITGQKRPYSYDGPSVEDGSGELEGDEGGDELSPGSSHLEKKRRLTFEQVRSLERNFEMENKLEPERKMQLAKELGLRPRQVAVWFQNRRARWKTKQLERDYETLAADYERLKAEYEQILGEKKQLKAEVQRLSNSSDLKPEPNVDSQEFASRHNARSSPTVNVSLANLSKDETVSGSSDVLDADSPRTTDSSSSDVDRIDGHSPDSNSLSSFLGEDTALLQVPLEGMAAGAPNSGDGDGFHEFVDQSCNYLLLQLEEQSVLPWWDWP